MAFCAALKSSERRRAGQRNLSQGAGKEKDLQHRHLTYFHPKKESKKKNQGLKFRFIFKAFAILKTRGCWLALCFLSPPPSLSLCVSLPPYLYLILLSEATEAINKYIKRTESILFKSKTRRADSKIQTNRIYSQVPLQMVIC